ncbi:MAG TPA: exo-alpha-sialidase, partial [Actinomycetota bacterium]|nr:exo-alpha-sialidase [Actinomycetota bacterium]
MLRVLRALAAVAIVVPVAFGLGSTPAGAARHGPLFNHVSGVVSVDPNVARSTKGVSHVAAVPPASMGGIACPDHSGTNDRVNQECTNQTTANLRGRGTSQNETAAAVNPTDPSNVIASQNDYRRGDANCGVDWSMDGGKRWGSTTAPMTFTQPGFTNPRHYWHAGGDTSVGFDSSGEAYLMCQVFGRGATADEEHGSFGPS